MSLDRSKSYPVAAQSSATSIISLRKAEPGNSIREQLLNMSQLCANGLTESSTQTGDSDQLYPIVTQSSIPSFLQVEPTSIRSFSQAEHGNLVKEQRSFSQAEHGISVEEQLLDLSQLCANIPTESSTQTGNSVNSMP